MWWGDEFAYFNSAYDGLVYKLIKDIELMSGGGLSLDFILKAFSTSSNDMWVPTRAELVVAGAWSDFFSKSKFGWVVLTLIKISFRFFDLIYGQKFVRSTQARLYVSTAENLPALSQKMIGNVMR